MALWKEARQTEGTEVLKLLTLTGRHAAYLQVHAYLGGRGTMHGDQTGRATLPSPSPPRDMRLHCVWSNEA